MELPQAASPVQQAAVMCSAARRITSPGVNARRTQLVKRIRSLKSRFVAASASANGNGNGRNGADDSSEDILRRVEDDLKMLAEAEAAAEAALRKLETDKESLLGVPLDRDLEFEAGQFASTSGLKSSLADALISPGMRDGFGSPPAAGKLSSSGGERNSADSSAGKLEFSLEEIEKQLKDKVCDYLQPE